LFVVGPERMEKGGEKKKCERSIEHEQNGVKRKNG
jgi:hypothetical protein